MFGHTSKEVVTRLLLVVMHGKARYGLNILKTFVPKTPRSSVALCAPLLVIIGERRKPVQYCTLVER